MFFQRFWEGGHDVVKKFQGDRPPFLGFVAFLFSIFLFYIPVAFIYVSMIK